MLQPGMEVVPMIWIGLVLAAVVTTAFGALVVGVQTTDRRMRLRHSWSYSRADAFARKVLGVYVRQASQHDISDDVVYDHGQTGRR